MVRWQRFWTTLALAVLFVGTASARELPRMSPQEAGFRADRLDYIDQFYTDEVNKGELPGIVILIARHGKIVHFSAVGYADLEKKQKMQTDTLFRLYSMTKPITSTALMMLYEDARFEMQDPLDKYIPEFKDLHVLRDPDGALDDTVPAVHAPTVQDILRHTAGFTHGLETNPFDTQYTNANVFGLDVSLADMMTRLAKIPLRYQPGTKFVYSVGPDIQARLVEVLSGMSFEDFLTSRLFKPLEMKDTGFWVPEGEAKRLATVYWMKDGKLVPLDEKHGHPDGGVLVQPWSVNSYTARHKHTGGSFGLVSTAEDYWKFAQMILDQGQFDGKRYLSPFVVQYMTRDQLTASQVPDGGAGGTGLVFGLGFGVVEDPVRAGFITSEGTYFWGGAASTHFWVDPKLDMVVVAMTQDMNVPAADALWSQLRTLVYSALVQ